VGVDPPPPYRIETRRLVVRCWSPADAPLLKEAVDASIEHLRPWMPWVGSEPTTLDEKVELLRGFRARFDLGEDFPYGIFEPDESRVLGGAGLHRRVGPEALEIGYWLRPDAVGKGLMTETAGALTRAAFDHAAVDRVEIRIDPVNERSRRVPVALGYAEEATLRRRLPTKAGSELRDAVVYSLFESELAGSPAGAVEYRAFDAAGRPLD
jgi:RimJ/RimL family protein N-acetyltransferase